jgi:tripartite-type tricarboxylate transporter receptor subunit TctC
VTYKSIPPALPDLLAGRLAVAFLPVQLAAPLVASGELKALAVTSAGRSSAWPDLPTVAEAWAGVGGASEASAAMTSMTTGTARTLNSRHFILTEA